MANGNITYRVSCSLSPSDLTWCHVVSFTGQLAAGTCEIVTLDRDSSQPRRTIARQTARCACKKGQIAGTTRARPACVDGQERQLEQSLSG
uniref:TAFA chemokine like family member 5 n=1 Tax=Knipowitschia caucasica TaxID=637954 RepID=A0AAV2ITU1_KNICA